MLDWGLQIQSPVEWNGVMKSELPRTPERARPAQDAQGDSGPQLEIPEKRWVTYANSLSQRSRYVLRSSVAMTSRTSSFSGFSPLCLSPPQEQCSVHLLDAPAILEPHPLPGTRATPLCRTDEWTRTSSKDA